MRDKENSLSFVHIDLHLHSDASDGHYTPLELAELLAINKVKYAVLTDHNTISGLIPFHRACMKYGISDISGVELHGLFDNKDLHILAYGFDPDNKALFESFSKELHVEEIIKIIHYAGGISVLAHPLEYGYSGTDLQTVIKTLVKYGLDGIEVFYKSYTDSQQKDLAKIADLSGILASAGSDFHGGQYGSELPGITMPVSRWKSFRERLGEHARNGLHIPSSIQTEKPKPEVRINWKWLFLRIALPSLLIMIFFISLIFAFLLPRFEYLLLERRKEMTIELTNSAWSILRDYQREVKEGNMGKEEAQEAAIGRIRNLRYGPDLLDYFWITDMYPRMIMHPYRKDLEGEDLNDFTDPEGIKPFIEFVKQVEDHSSGYVRYIWQWQDDPDRMEAKESYVKGFEEWGWIIGTGLYIDDVKEQIDELTRNMIDLSFGVMIISGILLVLISFQSLKLEQKRSEAEEKLRGSHERYRTLVESSMSGTLLIADGHFVFANYTLLEMLEYTPREMTFLDLHDIIILKDNQKDRDILSNISSGKQALSSLEVKLKNKKGQLIPALLSANNIILSGKNAVVISIQDITQYNTRQDSIERDRLLSRLQTSLLYLTEPVSQKMSPVINCDLDTTIAKAVQKMNKNDQGIIIISQNNEPIGIITDQDIRERLIGREMDLQQPVSRIMSAPVISINEDMPVFEAILLTHDKNINSVVVTDAYNKISGIIQSSHMLRPDEYSPMILTNQIRASKTIEELKECYERLPSLIGSLIESGALAQNICQVVSIVSDGIMSRVIELIIQETGTPPIPFAVMVLGSEARKEQTLATDQDNALIYADSDDNTSPSDYFLRFGQKLSENLNYIGYKYCKGNNMVNNKKWNQPVRKWKEYFDEWFSEPEGKALAYCNVFFDQRCVYGDLSLFQELKYHIFSLQENHPAFLSFMALNTLRYKVPLGLFGKILTDTHGGSKNRFDIKDALLPIINFARLYAIKYRIEETNTFERLERLFIDKVLHEDSYRSISQAYGHLMQMRFRHQTEMIKNGNEPDNFIDLSSLTQLEESILKNSLSQISVMQKKLAHDYHANI